MRIRFGRNGRMGIGLLVKRCFLGVLILEGLGERCWKVTLDCRFSVGREGEDGVSLVLILGG